MFLYNETLFKIILYPGSLKLSLTASGYEQKALVAPSADTSPGTLTEK
jgi:hypothetical protein